MQRWKVSTPSLNTISLTRSPACSRASPIAWPLRAWVQPRHSAMTRFLLVRHAAIDAHGRSLPGRSPGVHLNALGRQQAQALAQRLSGLPVAALYSSPLERAVETAEPIATLLGLQTATSEDFLE